MAKLRVHKKGFVFVKRGKKIKVKPTDFMIKDQGAPGHGEKVIPPTPEKRKGTLNALAVEMGYERVSDVPQEKMDVLAEKMVKKFGKKRAMGMSRVQVIFRKRQKGVDVSRFQKLDEEVNKIQE